MVAHAVRDLSERRVPHIVGGYLAAGWGLVEFSSFLEGRMLFSPHWTNFVLLGLALLLPSVVILAYNHGRPGRDRWLGVEKVGVPVNVLGAVGVLLFLFSGKDLGAVTTTVTVEDEEGNEVERVIPKSEFRKRVALFHFTPIGGAPAMLWYGLGEALRVDLSQDMFLELRIPMQFREDQREAGFDDPTAVPVSLRRQLAAEMHLDYMLEGEVAREGGGEVVATARIHELDGGRVVEEITARGADVFEVADSLSVALRRSLGVPAAHIEDNPDISAREMFTDSDDAFARYVEALMAIELEDDWAGALQALEGAVEHDPTFALANLNLYVAALFGQQLEKSLPAIEAANQHAYRLPERIQYDIRYSLHYARQDVGQARKVLEMKGELFPDDIQAQEQLALMNQLQGDREAAVANLERVLELAPSKTEHLKSLASLHTSMGKLDEALEYLDRYAATHPDDASSYTALGDLYRRMGRLEDARNEYERARTVDDDPSLLRSLASLERDMGEFEAAEAHMEEWLETVSTPLLRSGALGELASYHAYRGSMTRALEYFSRQLRTAAPVAPPLVVLDLQSELLDDYVAAGRPDEAERILAGLAAQLQPPLDILVAFMELELAVALEDTERARAAAARAEPAFEMFAIESERGEFLELLGRVDELEGDCDGAMERWRAQLTLDPTDSRIPARMGRCLRKLGNLEGARTQLEKTLALIPSHPEAHYELALVHEATGDREAAVEELRKALRTWAPADASFLPARRAREKLASLTGESVAVPEAASALQQGR